MFRDQDLFDFASLGSYLEFDLFGNECSHYQLNRLIDMPSDAQRIGHIYKLVAEGYENKLLISHDIHTKHRLVSLQQYFPRPVRIFFNALSYSF